MAEASKQPENSKRRVKNPETFRERAVKAGEGGEKVGIPRRILTPIGHIIKSVFSFVKRVIDKLFSFKIMRPLAAVFRFLGKVLLPKYFRESWDELRKVTWPNWKLSRQLTSAVLIFAVAFGASVAIVDYGLDKIFRNILLK